MESARALLPDRNFIYLADRAGFPYGTKQPEEVRSLAVRAVLALSLAFNPAAIVVACNTATEVAIDAMRKAVPNIPIVGTVPAIKPAAALSRKRRIAVVATQRAAEEPYLLNLAHKFAADCQLTRIGDGKLVNFVENKLFQASTAERLEAVQAAVQTALQADADVLVLGCTHFLHMTDDFAAAVPPDQQLILVDSRDGVARQLVRVLQSDPRAAEPLATNSAESAETAGISEDRFYLTGEQDFEERFIQFARHFRLSPAGTLHS